MRILDITQPLRPGMPVWPGDQPFEPAWSARRSEGSSVNVGAVCMSLHTGTHVDAPLHVSDEGVSVDALSLEALVGPAVLIEAMGSGAIQPDELAAAFPSGNVQRVLIKTRNEPPPALWTNKFRYLSPEAARYLADRGVVLVGIDTPSVDHPESKDLPVHHILYDAGIVNVENLYLSEIQAGKYQLICLPITVEGMDAGPARAVLVQAANDEEYAS